MSNQIQVGVGGGHNFQKVAQFLRGLLPPANEVWSKVIFLHLSVILFILPGGDPPPPGDGYCCGRYASYWNAFLLINDITPVIENGQIM